MTRDEIYDFIKSEVQGRWNTVEITQAQKDDLYLGLSNFIITPQVAIEATRQLRAESNAATPNTAKLARMALELARSRTSQEMKKKYQHVCVYAVLVEPHINQRWKPGLQWSVWFNEVPVDKDITSDENAMRLINATREYMLSHGMEPHKFAFYFNVEEAQKKSRELKGINNV